MTTEILSSSTVIEWTPTVEEDVVAWVGTFSSDPFDVEEEGDTSTPRNGER